MPVAVVGNVGTPREPRSPARSSRRATVVCEASSFQLEDTSAFAPEAAVLLNLGRDHLDRHGTLEAYHGRQAADVRPPGQRRRRRRAAGLGVEDLGGCARARVLRRRARGRAVRPRRTLWWARSRCSRRGAGIRGLHNVATRWPPRRSAWPAAWSSTRSARAADVRRRPHRLEEVATVDGVLYVNDSKATNVAAALVGLRRFEAPRARDPRRPGQGRGLRAAARGGRRALRRRVPDRRGRAALAAALDGARRCTTAATSSAPSPRPRAARPAGRGRAARRPPAPRTTSSPTSRRVGRLPVVSWRRS